MTRTPHSPAQRPDRTWLDRVNAWLVRQGDLIARLEAMSPTQERLSRGGDRDALESLLNDRERVLKDLEQEQINIGPELSDWDMYLAELSPADRQLLTQRVEAVAARVTGLLIAGSKDQKALESRRDALAEEIESLSRGRGAASAYGHAGSGATPRFQDREA